MPENASYTLTGHRPSREYRKVTWILRQVHRVLAYCLRTDRLEGSGLRHDPLQADAGEQYVGPHTEPDPEEPATYLSERRGGAPPDPSSVKGVVDGLDWPDNYLTGRTGRICLRLAAQDPR